MITMKKSVKTRIDKDRHATLIAGQEYDLSPGVEGALVKSGDAEKVSAKADASSKAEGE